MRQFFQLRDFVSGTFWRGYRSAWWLAFLLTFGLTPALEGQITAVIDPSAQRPGTVEGSIVHALTGRPLVGVVIAVLGTPLSTRSDSEGAFRLSSVPPGTRSLTLMAEGMRSLRITELSIQPGRTVRLGAIDLRPTPLDGVELLEAMYVSASHYQTSTDVDLELIPLAQVIITPSHYSVVDDEIAASTTLTQSDLNTLPQLGEDLYRAVLRIPGVTASDSSARFWVRGAPNDQVLSRFDGVDLFEPFHVKDFDGALSIIDLDTVGQVDLITGGFTAEYGNRLAGVLKMESENFDPLRPKNSLGISLTGARASKRGDFGEGRGHWLVSLRGGYPDLVLSQQWSENGNLRTRYEDVNGKIEYQLSPSHTLSFHLLRARDSLEFDSSNEPSLTSRYGSDYLWTRWQGSFGERLSGESVVSLSHLTWRHRAHGQLDKQYAVALRDDRELTQAGMRQDWTLTFSENAVLRSGFDVKWGNAEYKYDLSRQEPAFPDNSLFLFGTVPIGALVEHHFRGRPEANMFGAYLAPRIRLGSRLTIEPSVRFDRQDYTADQTVSPRLNASYALQRTTLRAAWGYYYQSQGLHELGVADLDFTFHGAERAEHRVLSLEHRLDSGVAFRAEAYERVLTRLRPHWENLVNVGEAFPELKMDRRVFNPTRASTHGVELILENRRPGIFNWATSYAISSAKETVDERVQPRNHDQQHTFAADLSYTPNPRWSFSAAWQYHTGWPTTEVTFRRTQLVTGEYVVIADVGEPYAVRLPAYHRLDLRVTRYFRLARGARLRVYADVFNAYNRDNIVGYEYVPVADGALIKTEKRTLRQFSLLPNMGAVWEF